MKIIPGKSTVIIFLTLISVYFLNAQNKGEDISLGKYDKIFSKIINEERTIMISLPWDYESSQKKYPVLYLLDGDIPSLAESYYYLNSFGPLLPGMIIVAVKNTNRNRDVLPGEKISGADNFLGFFTEELFPYIEQNYRTDSYRILYGASNAGVFVIYALLKKQNAFDAYIASSPTICWRYDYMMKKVNETYESKAEMNKYLYIIYGDKEWSTVRDTLAKFLPVMEKLKNNNLKMKINYLPEESHVPQGSLFSGLKYIFEGYEYPEIKEKNEGLDSLIAYYERFSQKMNHKFNIPSSVFIGLCQSMLSKKQVKQALDILKLCEKIYPGYLYCEIFLAITYYKDGNMDLAKKYYLLTKADKEFSDEPPFTEWKEMNNKFK
jgi:uncharacterized protein